MGWESVWPGPVPPLPTRMPLAGARVRLIWCPQQSVIGLDEKLLESLIWAQRQSVDFIGSTCISLRRAREATSGHPSG